MHLPIVATSMLCLANSRRQAAEYERSLEAGRGVQPRAMDLVQRLQHRERCAFVQLLFFFFSHFLFAMTANRADLTRVFAAQPKFCHRSVPLVNSAAASVPVRDKAHHWLRYATQTHSSPMVSTIFLDFALACSLSSRKLTTTSLAFHRWFGARCDCDRRQCVTVTELNLGLLIALALCAVPLGEMWKFDLVTWQQSSLVSHFPLLCFAESTPMGLVCAAFLFLLGVNDAWFCRIGGCTASTSVPHLSFCSSIISFKRILFLQANQRRQFGARKANLATAITCQRATITAWQSRPLTSFT